MFVSNFLCIKKTICWLNRPTVPFVTFLRCWITKPHGLEWIFRNIFWLLNKLFKYRCFYVLCLAQLMWPKSTFHTANTTASIVDTSFEYFMVIWNSVTLVDTIDCLISLKAYIFNISSTSAGDGDFGNSISLLDTTAPMFAKFSLIDSTFVWTIAPKASVCKFID